MTTELVKNNDSQDCCVAKHEQQTKTYTPRADIWEGEDGVVLHADMPGVTATELDIQFEDQELRIHGKVSPRQTGELLSGEYGIGDFARSFTIGETIDTEKISAELRDGVLTVHLPKVESVKARRIAVTSN